MTRRFRVTTSLLAVLILALLGAGRATSAPAPVVETPVGSVVGSPAVTVPTEGSAVDGLSACIARRKSADVVFLMDESLSLRQSDPAGSRVTAAQYLAQQWAQLDVQTSATINLAVLGYGASTEQLMGFTPLGAANATQVHDVLESARSRNTRDQTDHWMAIDGARKALAVRGPAADRCQAVVWFSDGKLDTNATYPTSQGDAQKPYASSRDLTAEQATNEARADLCRFGGLADQLRRSNIVILAVGLQVNTAASDFDDMKGVALGSAVKGSTTCGKFVDPVPGDFRLASDVDGLLFLFDRLRNVGDLPLEQQLGICQGTVCAAQSHRFVLDGSIGSVHVLASSDLVTSEVALIPPGHAPVVLPRGAVGTSSTVRLGASSAAVQWLSDKTVAVDLTPQSRTTGWTGVWSLVFVDKTSSSPTARSRTALEISADIHPTWLATPPGIVHAGEQSKPVTFALADGAGKPIDPRGLLGTASLTAVVVDADGATIPVVTGADKNTMSTPRRLDLTTAAVGAATVRLTLEVTTAAAKLADGSVVKGTALTPQSVALPLRVNSPVGYPTVIGALDFGTLEDAGQATRTLDVTGPGCVWLTVAGVVVDTAPDKVNPSISTPSATSAASCLAVPEGGRATLQVTLRTAMAANGAVTGRMSLSTAPSGELSRVKSVAVEFQANLDKAPNVGLKVAVFLIALLLGFGIPLLLLYLVKWRTSRIPPLTLMGQLLAVSVRGDELLRDGSRLAVRPTDLRQLVPIPASGARTLSVDGVELRTSMGWSPFGPGSVQVWRPGSRGASSTDGATRSSSGATRLPLAVHNSWVIFRDAGSTDTGFLLILLGDDSTGQRRVELIEDAQSRAAELFGRLSDGASPPSGGGNDSFGAGGSGTGPTPSPSMSDPLGDPTPGSFADPFGVPARGSTAGPARPGGIRFEDPANET